MESNRLYKTGGELSQKFVDAIDRRMNNIEYMDDERLLELYKKQVEELHYSPYKTHKEVISEFKYSLDEVYQEILTRMNN